MYTLDFTLCLTVLSVSQCPTLTPAFASPSSLSILLSLPLYLSLSPSLSPISIPFTLSLLSFSPAHSLPLSQGPDVCVPGTVSLTAEGHKVPLTFRRRAHQSSLVSMAAVAGDKRPASALTQGGLVTTATQALVVKEARTRAERGRLHRCADLPEVRNGSYTHTIWCQNKANDTMTDTMDPSLPTTQPVCRLLSCSCTLTPGPAVYRPRWHPAPSSESHTQIPTGRSDTPPHGHFQRPPPPAGPRLTGKKPGPLAPNTNHTWTGTI